MPSADIVKKTVIGNSFRVEKVKGCFDLANVDCVKVDWHVSIPIEGKDWNIGLIVGSSGSGKTTIAREVFPDYEFFTGYEWQANSIVDDFPKECSVEQITDAFGHVGLTSAPDWLKPFAVLSNGQKMRAELARLFLTVKDTPVIYDEFTSVVDRQVAQVSSYAISKFIRQKGQKFIAVSCHRDIEEWLLPDWLYDTDTQTFAWRSVRQRPSIKLDIREGKQSEWVLFREHHYMNKTHNTAAKSLVAEYNGVPVAWCSWLHMPHPISKNLKRIHRLVVRPDYQGLGIGKILLNYVASSLVKKGFRCRITTSLKAFVVALNRSKEWVMKHQGYMSNGGKTIKKELKKTLSSNRITASFEYCGA